MGARFFAVAAREAHRQECLCHLGAEEVSGCGGRDAWRTAGRALSDMTRLCSVIRGRV